jgi:hypothetical protein
MEPRDGHLERSVSSGTQGRRIQEGLPLMAYPADPNETRGKKTYAPKPVRKPKKGTKK